MIKLICVGKIKEKYLIDAIEEYKKRLSKYTKLQIIEVNDIDNQINGTNNVINNNLTNEEEEIINEYYKTINIKNEVQSNLDKQINKKNELSHNLEEYEYSVKKDNQLFNQKNNELKQLEIDINRADVKLDNLLNTLNEEYTITYEKAKKLYKLSIDNNIAHNTVNSLKRKIKEFRAKTS